MAYFPSGEISKFLAMNKSDIPEIGSVPVPPSADSHAALRARNTIRLLSGVHACRTLLQSE